MDQAKVSPISNTACQTQATGNISLVALHHRYHPASWEESHHAFQPRIVTESNPISDQSRQKISTGGVDS